MRWIMVFLAAFLIAGLTAHASDDALDAYIDREMPAAGAPGLAHAVVEDETVRTGARGVARIGEDEPVTAQTPFLIGSISKSITALAVMQRVEAGALELDAPVSRYLPAFRGRPAGDATIRQLLSHTSGFSTLQGNTGPAPKASDPSALARRAEALAGRTPAAAPGARWAYSNANYVVLGAVVEHVSGRDYADYVEAEIFEPLGMVDSFVSDGEIHPAMASGHQPWFGARRALDPAPTDPGSAPAGGVVASAPDLGRYLAAMVNGEADILSVEGKAAMLRPASEVSPYYGFGWSLDPDGGSAYHTGVSPGVETLAVLLPDERRAVVVLVNAGSGFGFGETTQLRTGLAAVALGLPVPDFRAHWSRKLMFLGFAAAPILFGAAAAWALRHRAGLRAKSGAFGLFSLWFPLVTTGALALTALYLIPRLFGVTLAKLGLFQPDLVLLMTATTVTGLVWAVLRLAIAYTGERDQAATPSVSQRSR